MTMAVAVLFIVVLFLSAAKAFLVPSTSLAKTTHRISHTQHTMSTVTETETTTTEKPQATTSSSTRVYPKKTYTKRSNSFDYADMNQDTPDFEIPYKLIAELEAKAALALANKKPSAMDEHKIKIAEAIQRWRKHETDVGSSEVQVAIAHERIQYLTAHLLNNRKDLAARRGLDAIVTDRRIFLNYLYKQNPEKAMLMVNELGIRFKPPMKYQDREAKYMAFKNTKSVKALEKIKMKRAIRDAAVAKAVKATDAAAAAAAAAATSA